MVRRAAQAAADPSTEADSALPAIKPLRLRLALQFALFATAVFLLLGAAFIALSDEVLEAPRTGTVHALIIAVSSLYIAAALFALIFGRHLTSRLAKVRNLLLGLIGGDLACLTRAFDAVAAGDLGTAFRPTSEPVAERGSDEITQLTGAYNSLARGFQHLGAGYVRMTARLRAALATAEELAYVDELTALPNRRALERSLAATHESSVGRGAPYSLVLADLDRFKLINDTHGHRYGDRILQRIADRLRQGVRVGDVVGRWGGEEFLCILPGTAADCAREVAERLRALIAEEALAPGLAHDSISASFGVSSYPVHGDTVETLLGRADMALYRAKSDGRDRVAVARSDGRGLYFLATQVVRALDAGEIRVAYQPIVDLATRARVGEEALARIVDADGATIPAAAFIKLAEDLHLVHRVDAAVLPQVLDRSAASRHSEGYPFYRFVNISPQLFQHGADVDALAAKVVAHHHHDVSHARNHGHALVLEITERVGPHDVAALVTGLKPFLDAGCRLAIDDFGSGVAPLQYLADLPVSYVKLSGDLVAAIDQARVRNIIAGVVGLAERLRITTIAEGVEDDACAHVLSELGVRWAQGCLFGRPSCATTGASLDQSA